MRKIGKLLALMGAGYPFCSASFAEETTSKELSGFFHVLVPQSEEAFEATGSALFLRPSAGNLGWGVITNFLPIETPTWKVKAINPGYQSGFNVGIRYITKKGIDVQCNWMHLRTSDSQSASVTPVLQWVSPFSQTGPGTASTKYDPTGVGELTQAHAKVDFHYDTVHLDAGTFVNVGDHLQIRLFTGLTGAKIKERLTSTFKGAESLPKITLTNSSSYLGMGPHFGIDSSFILCNNLRFLGQIASGLLFGSMRPAQYLFRGSSDALAAIGIAVNSEEIRSERVSQTVPYLNMKIGLNYTYHFRKGSLLVLEAGYMGEIYLNALSGYETNENVLPLELGSLSTGSMKHIQSNFSINGPYAKLSLKF